MGPTSNDSLRFCLLSLLGPKAVPDVEQVQLRIWLAGHGLASGLNIPNILAKHEVLRVVENRYFFLRGW